MDAKHVLTELSAHREHYRVLPDKTRTALNTLMSELEGMVEAERNARQQATSATPTLTERVIEAVKPKASRRKKVSAND